MLYLCTGLGFRHSQKYFGIIGLIQQGNIDDKRMTFHVTSYQPDNPASMFSSGLNLIKAALLRCRGFLLSADGAEMLGNIAENKKAPLVRFVFLSVEVRARTASIMR